MRVFLGVPAPEKIVEAIQIFRKEHEHLHVRWIEDENLHITLIPPWDEEQNADFLKKKLDELENIPELALNFHTIELGSNKRDPNLIWLVGEAPLKLLSLKNRAEQLFDKPHRAQFKMHITLARLYKDKIPDFPKQTVNWNGSVQKVVIYESLGYSQYRKVAQR